MLPNERITEYCRQAAEQIRWKRARPAVIRELEQHLQDQQEAYMKQGSTQEQAVQMAIAQMGDAREVGQALDQAHRPQPPWFPLLVVMGLLVLGAALQVALGQQMAPLISYAVAAGLFVLGYFGDISWLGKHAMEIYLGVLVFSVALLIGSEPMAGAAVFHLEPIHLQLCYLALVFPSAYGLFLYGMKGLGTRGILFSILGYLPFALILMLVPALSGLLIYSAAAGVMLAAAIRKNWFGAGQIHFVLKLAVPVLLPAGALAAAFLSVGGTRLQVFLNPWLDAADTGRIYCLLRDAVAQAAFWGEGRADLSMIPALSENYALLYGIQKFGLGAFAGVMLLVLAFGVFCIIGAMRQRSMLGTLLVLAAALTVTLQAFVYAYANLGYGLWDALSFPFLSRGNTALLLDALLVGMMLSVLRTGAWVRDSEHPQRGIRILRIER